MQIYPDTQSSLTPNPDDVMSTREFLGVSTFIKPRFAVAVAPRSGSLEVRVEASPNFELRRRTVRLANRR